MPGQEIEWERLFGARCLPCGEARRYPERANRRSEACSQCGTWVIARSGRLEPEGEAGWRVLCGDRAGCETRAERRAHVAARGAARAQAKEQRLLAAIAALRGGPRGGIAIDVHERVLVPGGWPTDEGRAEEWSLLTSHQGAWLARYGGERDGSWLRPPARRLVEGVILTPVQAHDLAALT